MEEKRITFLEYLRGVYNHNQANAFKCKRVIELLERDPALEDLVDFLRNDTGRY